MIKSSHGNLLGIARADPTFWHFCSIIHADLSPWIVSLPLYFQETPIYTWIHRSYDILNATLSLLCLKWRTDFFISVQFSCSVMSDSLWLNGWQHTRPPCLSPLNRWCHPAIGHVHRVSVQPSHPLLSPSPPVFNLSQHQGFNLGHTWMVEWFSLLSLSLNFAIKSSCSEPQSTPSLVFADYIDLLHHWLQRI